MGSLRVRALLASVAVLAVALPAAAHAAPPRHGQAARGQVDWGAVATGLDLAHREAQGSPGVTIAIFDSGVDPHVLPERMVQGASFVGSGPPVDLDGHGTAVAVVAASACPRCSIMPVRVLGADGRGPYEAIARGIRWAADRGAQVINLSLTIDRWNAAVGSAVIAAEARGAVVVAAAGNSGTTRRIFPAAIRGVLSVAGSQPDGSRAPDSDYGRWVSLVAPGCAPAYAGDTGWFCGTSAAAPYVAGAAALYRSRYPAATATDTAAALLATARPVDYAGAGLLRADAALALPPRT